VRPSRLRRHLQIARRPPPGALHPYTHAAARPCPRPLRQAFAEFLQSRSISLSDWLADRSTVAATLNYHVVPNTVAEPLARFYAKVLPTWLPGKTLTIATRWALAVVLRW
jgi:hypothetical protein